VAAFCLCGWAFLFRLSALACLAISLHRNEAGSDIAWNPQGGNSQFLANADYCAISPGEFN
jgi:hypothetical protein